MECSLLISIQRFVGTDIERANGDRPTFHVDHGLTVGFKLLVFGWEFFQMTGASHKQKFGTEQANTISASFQRGSAVAWQFDISQQGNTDTILSNRWGLLEASQFFLFTQHALLACAILCQHQR